MCKASGTRALIKVELASLLGYCLASNLPEPSHARIWQLIPISLKMMGLSPEISIPSHHPTRHSASVQMSVWKGLDTSNSNDDPSEVSFHEQYAGRLIIDPAFVCPSLEKPRKSSAWPLLHDRSYRKMERKCCGSVASANWSGAGSSWSELE